MADGAAIRGFDYGPFCDGENPNLGIFPTPVELDHFGLFTSARDGDPAIPKGPEQDIFAASSTLYYFLFTYNDFAANGAAGGDYYYGTVADDGRFGYVAGTTIITALGSYYVYGTAGKAAQAAGTVNDNFYWDGAGSHQRYAPYYSDLQHQGYSPVDGAGGLGNDFDYIVDNGGQFHIFGGGLAEAVVPPATLFDFFFTFNDFNVNGATGGDDYYGTVADDGHFGYMVGQTITTALGSYHIYSTAGETKEVAGTVNDYFYYDGAGKTHSYYYPYYSAIEAHSAVDGPGGLGNDFDYIVDSAGQFHIFGGGLAEAIILPWTQFNFYFTFNDFAAKGSAGGDYYYGTVVDDGRFGYAAGETLVTALGTYHIYGAAPTTTRVAGVVNDYFYWDGAVSGKVYTPYYSGLQGQSAVSGGGGLAQDFDYIIGGAGDFHVFGGSLAETHA